MKNLCKFSSKSLLSLENLEHYWALGNAMFYQKTCTRHEEWAVQVFK